MNNWQENMKRFAARLGEIWRQMNLNQKLLVGAGALLLVIAVIVFLVSNRSAEFEVLYTDLSEKNAQAIVEKLEEDKIAYRLEDNGTTILVDPAAKYRTRLELAGENLPEAESGFELFQENKFGETQTDKKVKYQVALQGELARTIQSLEDVKAARVHLVLPEETLFSDNAEAPSAAVALTTKDGATLSAKEVQGIINLIANSIEGLSPESVVIVDHNGNLLSEQLQTAATGGTEQVQNQLAMKRQFEKDEAALIQSMLDKTLGKDNAVVRVSAELNFNQVQETTETYSHDPNGQFVRSEHIVTESGSDQANPAQGVPGTDTNIPQYAETETNGSSSTYDKTDKSREYEINKVQTVTQYAVGNTKYDYLTVSVLVNQAGTSHLKLGDSEEEKVEKVRSIVATAVGLKENRTNENVSLDENISVAFMDFYSEPVPEPEEQTGLSISTPLIAGIGAGVVVIALLLFIAMRRKKQAELQAMEEMKQAEFEAVVDEEISIEDLFDKNLTPEEREKQKVRQEVDKLVMENPENAAQVIKTWLLEDQR